MNCLSKLETTNQIISVTRLSQSFTHDSVDCDGVQGERQFILAAAERAYVWSNGVLVVGEKG